MTAAAIPIELPHIPAPPPLPPLRQELRIEPGAPLVNGAPSWTLFDPVRHMFFQLGRIEYIILSRWASGNLADVGRDLMDHGLDQEESNDAFNRVVEFSAGNSLTMGPVGRGSVEAFLAQRAAAKKAAWKWLLDNYLFVRIPMVKPGAFLQRTLPRVAPLWSFYSLVFFAALAVAGLLFVAREWDAFLASFMYFFSWQGALAYAAGLFTVKILHELGHAYTATRFGCRVPTMGVSFLVMMPVLYTDTTGAWRIRSRRKRLAIDCAGVAAELMVASAATMMWVILPDGTVRSVAFILATTSWVMSLAVNLNPFMRFDGYYVLSDLLDVPNLQPRAFALGRWKMRELLFSLGEPAPEAVPRNLRTSMIAYAYATWVYRLFLFTGIALLVYHLFFQPLGLILFLVEMGVFVVRPVLTEFAVWHRMKDRILSSRRGKAWVWIAGILLLLAVLPLDRHVTAHGVLSPVGANPIVAGEAARVERIFVEDGQTVAAGAPLVQLEAPEMAAEAAASAVRLAQLKLQFGRAVADARDLSNRAVIESEMAREEANLAGLRKRTDKLVLRAPVAGVVSDLTRDIHPGRWIAGSEIIAYVLTPSDYDVQAYVSEDDVWRLEPGSTGVFIADDAAGPSRAAKLIEVSSTAIDRLDQPILASVNGGPVAVDKDGDTLKPREALYRIRLVAEKGAVGADGRQIQVTPGKIEIRAPGRSIAMKVFGAGSRMLRQII